MVHWNVEETLDCVLMQIDRDDVISAGDGNEVGYELCRDGAREERPCAPGESSRNA